MRSGMSLGEDDEAAMPTRMTDNIAAIYISALRTRTPTPSSK